MKLSQKIVFIGSMIFSSGQHIFGCATPTLTISNIYTSPMALTHMAYSPDGTEVAITSVTANSNIRILNTSTGNLINQIANSQSNSALTYSPDGSLIALINTTSNQLQIYDRINLDPIPLVSLSLPTGVSFTSAIAYSPNGEYIAVANPATGGGVSVVKVGHPISNSSVLYSFSNLSFIVRTPTSVSFSPDSNTLAVANQDQVSGSYCFTIINMSNSAYTTHNINNSGSHIQFSPDGRYLAVAGGIILYSYDTSTYMPIGQNNSFYGSMFSYSPDSKYITYIDYSSSPSRLRLLDATNVNTIITQLNVAAGDDYAFFNPNGQQISNTNGNTWKSYNVNNRANLQVDPVFAAGCNNDTTLALTATGANLSSIQWTLPNGTTSSANPLTANTSGLYVLNVSDTSNNCNGTTRLVYLNSEPAISQQPVSQTITDGSTVVFTVAALPATTTYQWQVSTDGGTTFTDIVGQITNTYSFTGTANESGNQYRVALVNPAFPQCATVSDAATLTISGTITPMGPLTLCFGGSVVLTAQTSAISPTYQWYSSVDNVTFNPIAGETVQTYEATASGFYRVAINSINTQSVQITINSQVSATITPSGSVQINQGDSILLTANSGIGLTYAWFQDGVFINNTQSITVSTAANYTVTVTDSLNCSSTSAPTTVIVIPSGTISVQITPSTQEVPLGGTATFTANVISGTVNTFTWTGPNNFTATGNTITLTDVTRDMLGLYYLTAANGTNSITVSASLGLQSSFNVAITTPSLMNVLTSNVTLTAVVSGQTGPFIYAWTGPNGFSLIGNNSSITIGNFSREDIGQYSVTVYDVDRNSDTASINLTGIAVTSSSGSATQNNTTKVITSSVSYTLEVIGGSGQYSYLWYGANIYPTVTNANLIYTGNSMTLGGAGGPGLYLPGTNNLMQFALDTPYKSYTSSNKSTLQITLRQDPIILQNGSHSLKAFASIFVVLVFDANGNSTIVTLPIGQKLDEGDLSSISAKYNNILKTRAPAQLLSIFTGGYAIGSKDQKLLLCMQTIACAIASAIVLAVVSAGTFGALPLALGGSAVFGSTSAFGSTSLAVSIVASLATQSSGFFSLLSIPTTIAFTRPGTTAETTTTTGNQIITVTKA